MKLERKVYETRREKRIDFALGFGGMFVLNALIAGTIFLFYYYLDNHIAYGPLAPLTSCIAFALPLMINVLAILGAALTRKWIALGALSAVAAVFLLLLFAGIFLMAMCFTNF